MKHTKGPWRVAGESQNEGEAEVIGSPDRIIEACQLAINKLSELEQDAQREGKAIFIAEEMDKLEKAIIKVQGN